MGNTETPRTPRDSKNPNNRAIALSFVVQILNCAEAHVIYIHFQISLIKYFHCTPRPNLYMSLSLDVFFSFFPFIWWFAMMISEASAWLVPHRDPNRKSATWWPPIHAWEQNSKYNAITKRCLYNDLEDFPPSISTLVRFFSPGCCGFYRGFFKHESYLDFARACFFLVMILPLFFGCIPRFNITPFHFFWRKSSSTWPPGLFLNTLSKVLAIHSSLGQNCVESGENSPDCSKHWLFKTFAVPLIRFIFCRGLLIQPKASKYQIYIYGFFFAGAYGLLNVHPITYFLYDFF